MADDPCTPLRERAAIMEFDGGMTRAEAERKAREDVETFAERARKAEEKQCDLF